MIKGFIAYDLALELHHKAEALELKHHVKDQLTRATLSVALNLAEGSGKPSHPEKRRFYAIAFGSIREVQAIFQLMRIQDKKLIDKADHVAACLYRLVYKPAA
ncbi:MAG: four helix bundle protein [Deltaproteobacteria bacterium]|nr:four helix bundle protein [Deltaproteobacteria bacterium]